MTLPNDAQQLNTLETVEQLGNWDSRFVKSPKSDDKSYYDYRKFDMENFMAIQEFE